ncbi:DEAD/DEAH box helicase [Flavivirga jejuensis]|uniref:DEAD/DEAH box helicase family protein n=1 Tax=Flavivirga jejuensis TaxID=870487 RepID=A0ABT8WVI7_9FLAO|nr:DEAD/DEAH box helicase family protein [Flavivirga jejuensis]MDO5977164.1 DEAD/DEAH box helicase family protein [Flavivirga jejuensis]
MVYFSENYSRINLPIAKEGIRGLRNAQIGAIHAIGSHFTIRKETPAIIIMPTGSGKTAVLVLAAFLLQAKRVLVLSSSVLVRGQIFKEFNDLETLKYCNVFHNDLNTPKVKEIKSPITNIQEWEELNDYDVVIGIPKSINEGINDTLSPPEDLFDLILVDEAHHVPAYTWSNTVEAFENAKKVYFTATPFRRDKKEIKGITAFNYPLSKAYEDKIFGEIGYYAVKVEEGVDPDLAIAREADKIFKQDRLAGLKHYIMVRTSSKVNAKELNDLYQDNTTLRLRRVDSTKTYRYIRQTIAKLKKGELDGIICVDMLGEGFDFPNLKIGVIHQPHKSLAVTLQFIGRFARTNAENIGEAKFIAIPNNITIGRKQLFAEGAIWNDIIKDLSEQTIIEEDEIKEVLDTFELTSSSEDDDDQFSLYNLNPYFHVKVYKTEEFNIYGEIDIPNHEVIHEGISEENAALIFVTRETIKPKWIKSEQIVNTKYYLFVIFYDEKNGLIFIHSSSIRTLQFYDDVIEEFSNGVYERISKHEINKVLVDLDDTEFFNIGMQNKSPNSGESYRTISGANAEKSIRKSHGRLYANGHVFGKAKSKGESITIGYSSGAKVWSNAYEKIPKLIKWCKLLGEKIVSDKTVSTKTGLDNLSIGTPISKFPFTVISSTWNGDTFHNPPLLNVMEEDEISATYQLLDFEIVIDKDKSDEDKLYFYLTNDIITIDLTYDFEEYYLFESDNEKGNYIIKYGNNTIDILDYLDDFPLHLYLNEFANVINHDYHKPSQEGELYFDPDRVESIDWEALNTDITIEFYEDAQSKIDNGNRNSIHDSLDEYILGTNPNVLIYDHGTGEVADHISINDNANDILIELFHVKGSSGPNPGDRVGDVYEVCMQAIKSQLWTSNRNGFKKKMNHRGHNKNEKFKRGTLIDFNNILAQNKQLRFKFTIVQPGISSVLLSEKLSTIIAASDDAIQNNGNEALRVLGS